jgi:hypothetical protein|tara:strand:- start:905 stop:1063 length:159 start_codon:yes stop_codon:yes gene_type:complete
MKGMHYKNIRPIEILHHEWCKKEGRDTSWFKRRKGDDLLEPKENKRIKRKRS